MDLLSVKCRVSNVLHTGHLGLRNRIQPLLPQSLHSNCRINMLSMERRAGWTSALDETSVADGDNQKGGHGVMGNSWAIELGVSLISRLALRPLQIPEPLCACFTSLQKSADR